MDADKIKNSMQCVLGESPIWLNNKLYYIDIKSGKIINYYNDVFKTIDLKEMITFIVPCNDNIVFSTKDKINYIDLNTEKVKNLFAMNFNENVRFNDGKCDINGVLFAGTMDMDEKNDIASLYRFDKNQKEILNKITISNGTIWNKNYDKMYYIDSPTKKIRVFDYDNKNSNIISENQSIDVSFSPGVPDGMTIDSEDNLYVCFFGGSHVLVLNKNGKLLNEIKVSSKNVSSCVFGNDDLKTLYITTAMDENGNGGYLYKHENNIEGTKSMEFKFL